MSRTPDLAGDIPPEGAIPVLQQIERRRVTGVLRFQSGQEEGELKLVCGEIATDQQEMPDGRDPVDVLLALGEGRFEVHQQLPSLPVSQGEDRMRRGSLAVHVPADLMNYCERCGLTGVLRLTQGQRQADVLYDAGELVGIRLDGRTDDDLRDVFGWEDGTFEVQARADPPRLDVQQEQPDDTGASAELQASTTPAPESAAGQGDDETGRQFLRVVEMALGQVVEDRESRRPASRSSPPLPEMSKPRRRHDSLPPSSEGPRRADEPTVKVAYLAAEQQKPAEAARTRRARKDFTGQMVLPDAAPERRQEEALRARLRGEARSAARANGEEPAQDAVSRDGRSPGKEPEPAVDDKPVTHSTQNEPGDHGAQPGPAERDASPETASTADAPGLEQESPPSTDDGSPEPDRRESDRRWADIGTGLLWAIAVLAVALASLAILARLPPLE